MALRARLVAETGFKDLGFSASERLAKTTESGVGQVLGVHADGSVTVLTSWTLWVAEEAIVGGDGGGGGDRSIGGGGDKRRDVSRTQV